MNIMRDLRTEIEERTKELDIIANEYQKTKNENYKKMWYSKLREKVTMEKEMNKNKGDGWMEYSNYDKHTIEETTDGCKITLYAKEGSKLEIYCKKPKEEK